MNKNLKLIILTLLLACQLSCTEKASHEFEINGKIETDVDSILMYPGFIAKEFLEDSLKDGFRIKVENKKFFIKGSLDYPLMFNIFSRVGFSESFFIENGNYDLKINLLEKGERDVFISKSETQTEYELLKFEKLDNIHKKFIKTSSKSEREKLKFKKDSIIVDYLKTNPNSYVALWLLIDDFCYYGYNIKQKESLDYFSHEIMKTSLYLKFKEKINEVDNFSFINKTFPLDDINLKLTLFDINTFKHNKYILIDFWFSHCGPCLAEMPKYKPIYNKYKEKGFEIVSISSEKINDITYWKKIISENEFNWVHYLDKNSIETIKLNINKFPTTYLVDNMGNVLVKNISIKELEDFLDKNLNGNISK